MGNDQLFTRYLPYFAFFDPMAERSVWLCEVGPRDGFQFESTFIPTEQKRDWIHALALAGLPRIQATSFVHPRWVPQMADAEALWAMLPEVPGTRYSALALNRRGVERALKTGVGLIDLSIATHPQHARDNVNMTVEEGMDEAHAMIKMALDAGADVQLGLQTVWGYAASNDVPLDDLLRIATAFADYPLESFSLADSTGLAHPRSIQVTVRALREILPRIPLVLHLHDTRGAGLANVVAALECGVTRFDTSLGGLGGCPFIPGATGNIATEDTAALLNAIGNDTRVDVGAVSVVSREVAAFLGRPLSGKMYRLAKNSSQ